ncbi:MAG TPA: hypothetical protein VIH35_00925 [Kiritimatiellia bacterium]|jgi:hypothetical protein
MHFRSKPIRLAVAVLTVLVLLFAGVAAYLHDGHCEHHTGCNDCVVECTCLSPLVHDLASVFAVPNLPVLGGACIDGIRLAPGTSDPLFNPPRA